MSPQDPAERPEKPKRPERKGFLLRLPPELMGELRGWANQELRSLNAHIEYLLRESLRRRQGRDDDRDEERS